jgi:hypothetical protein
MDQEDPIIYSIVLSRETSGFRFLYGPMKCSKNPFGIYSIPDFCHFAHSHNTARVWRVTVMRELFGPNGVNGPLGQEQEVS